jgi:acetyltransferase-like isoleucine patch superfamily enzyme
MGSLMLKIRRGESPMYRGLRDTGRRVLNSTLPLPHFFYPILKAVFNGQQAARIGLRWILSYFVYEPLFRGRCVSVGKGFRLWAMPYVMGHTKIYVGDNVNFFGKVDIFSGRLFDEPKLILGNRVDLGHNVVFLVNKEIVLGDDVNVASGVRFMDTDAHPRDTMKRIADLPPQEEEVKPVNVGRYAWIGHNSFIMKGVTIGEGAIIGVGSVVVSDIPAYCVAMGNPARVVVKNTNQSTVAAPATPK